MAKALTKAKCGTPETSAEHPAPNEREAASIQRARTRQEKRSAPLSYRLNAGAEGNQLGLVTQHTDAEGHDILARETFGTASEAFVLQSVGQLAAVLRERSQAVPTQTAMNAGLAAISGIAPQNEVEAMLAVQMVGTHAGAIEMLTRAKLATDPAWMERYGTLATKLLRTYTTQIEALAKLRRGGEQKVTVEHVHIYPGGQAIVGNVSTAGGGGTTKQDIRLMHSLERQPSPFRMTLRCCAKTWAGTPCMSPAVKGKARCRMHGGAKGSGSASGRANPNFRHGLRTKRAMAERRAVTAILRAARETLADL